MQINDLLDPKKTDLPIRQDRHENIIIPNLTEVRVSKISTHFQFECTCTVNLLKYSKFDKFVK